MGLLGAMPGAVAQGLVWGIMAIGVYITYKILDIADLTVDGSLCTGAAVCTMLAVNGVNIWICIFCALIAGALAGLIGHALIDASYGWGIWWSWVIASGVFGILMGIATKKINLEGGLFEKGDIARFNISQLICHVICWGGVAPVLDILIYNEPVEKLFAQGLFSGISNAVTTAIIGTLICIAYAKSKPKAGSLKKED